MNVTRKPAAIIFDVNETLLDMKPLKKKVNSLLNSKYGFKIWFGMLLQYSLVDNATGEYHPFPEIASAALELAATALDTGISEKEKKEALSLITQLPAYKDVRPGLQKLKDAGFALVTLTNSPPPTLTAQLAFAKLDGFFDNTLSIGAVKKYKPSPETYQYAARTIQQELSNVMMVAAHGWDIAGAIAAGMQTGFVARQGQGMYALAQKPSIIGKDILAIAKQVIAL